MRVQALIKTWDNIKRSNRIFKGIYHGYTWGDRPETTKLSNLNYTNLIRSVDRIVNDHCRNCNFPHYYTDSKNYC